MQKHFKSSTKKLVRNLGASTFSFSNRWLLLPIITVLLQIHSPMLYKNTEIYLSDSQFKYKILHGLQSQMRKERDSN